MKTRLLMLTTLLAAASHADDNTLTVWSSPVAESRDILNSNTLTQLEKHNVAEALATMAGVTLDKSGNRNELQVRVRGFNSRQVPVFYDGVPVYVPYDGNLDLSRFLTFGLGSLEVSKGYSSLLQGPNQMGGAINITSALPQKPFAGRVGFRQGWSRDKRNARESYAALGAKNDGGFIQLSASQLKKTFIGLAHGISNVAGQNGRLNHSAADDKKAAVRLGWTPGADRYTLSWSSQDGAKQSPPYAGSSGQAARYWHWPQYDKQSFYHQGSTRLSETLTLKSRLYHDAFKNTLLMYNSLAALRNKQGSYSHYDDYSNGAALQLSAQYRESDRLSFAVHWKNDMHREKGAKSAAVDRYQDRTWSLATEYQRAITDALDMVAGISYDWRDSLQALKHESNGSITRYDSNGQQAFNWQGMLKYYLQEGDTLTFSLSNRSRFPTLKERYTTFRPAYGQTALVNPQLKPERARSVDLSWSHAIAPRWRSEASLYYNRLSDTILIQNIDAQRVQNRNSGRVDYQGLDVGLHGKVGEHGEAGVNYGLIHSDVKQRSAGKVTALPRQTVTGWLAILPAAGWRLRITEEARSFSYSDSTAKQKAAGFALTHLRAELSPGAGWNLNAAINNVFDKKYALTEGFYESGRQYWLGAEYRF